MVFAGAGLNAALITRKIHAVNIAPGLPAYVGTKLPSAAVGNIFLETFD
jgi:hypothetical protein